MNISPLKFSFHPPHLEHIASSGWKLTLPLFVNICKNENSAKLANVHTLVKQSAQKGYVLSYVQLSVSMSVVRWYYSGLEDVLRVHAYLSTQGTFLAFRWSKARFFVKKIMFFSGPYLYYYNEREDVLIVMIDF